MAMRNINGSLNKWANIDWRERAFTSVSVLFLFINDYNLLNIWILTTLFYLIAP